MDNVDYERLRDRAQFIRTETVRLITIAKSGHYTSVFSAAEILAVLYYHVMRLSDDPNWADRDRLIRRYADRIVGVQVNDWREPTRGWCDRALPGEGRAGVPGILAALLECGYRGWYDLEIFSDDGTFGDAYPDSLWAEDAADVARRGHDAFRQLWARAAVEAGR